MNRNIKGVNFHFAKILSAHDVMLTVSGNRTKLIQKNHVCCLRQKGRERGCLAIQSYNICVLMAIV